MCGVPVVWRCNNGDPAKRIPSLLVGQDEIGFDELRDSGRFRQGQAGEQELDRELADGAGVDVEALPAHLVRELGAGLLLSHVQSRLAANHRRPNRPPSHVDTLVPVQEHPHQ